MDQVKFFKGCFLPQILLGPVLNTWTHLYLLLKRLADWLSLSVSQLCRRYVSYWKMRSKESSVRVLYGFQWGTLPIFRYYDSIKLTLHWMKYDFLHQPSAEDSFIFIKKIIKRKLRFLSRVQHRRIQNPLKKSKMELLVNLQNAPP